MPASLAGWLTLVHVIAGRPPGLMSHGLDCRSGKAPTSVGGFAFAGSAPGWLSSTLLVLWRSSKSNKGHRLALQ